MRKYPALVLIAAVAFGGGLFAATTLTSVQGQTQPGSRAVPAGEAIVPFKIRVPDAVLADLKRRLAQGRFADEFPDAGWDYGTNLTYLKSVVEYWREKYDWRAQENRLNAFDQFKTNIDGVDIHFIHQRSKNPSATPILLL